MTTKLLREVKPDYIMFCFDTKEPTFRNEMYSEYKANREEMPDDLARQMPYLRKLTDELGVPRIERDGFEADDLIGTLAKWGRNEGLDVVIVSSDKDFAQLIRPHVRMFDTMKDIYFDEEKVKEKWGVQPSQFLDYLALLGDSSDNVPGVRGVGEKTAQKLLSEFQTLDGIYQNIDTVKGALQKKLMEGKENAYLSKKLVTILQDMDLQVKPEDLRLRPIHRDQLAAMLDDLEIKSLKRKILDPDQAGAKASDSIRAPSTIVERKPESKPKTKGKKSAISDSVEEWSPEEFKTIAPYTELTVYDSERGLYFLVKGQVVRYAGEPKMLGEILSKKMVGWKGFDLKSTWRHLHVYNPIPAWDHMLAAYVINCHEIKSIEQLSKELLKRELSELPTPQMVFETLAEIEAEEQIKLQEQSVEKIYNDIEVPSAVVLYDMEIKGIEVDGEELHKQSATLSTDIYVSEKQIFELAGETFNIASPKQLGNILFNKLKLPVIKRTKTGISTDSDVLEKLASSHAICKFIVEYRELTKLKSTYVDALPELIDKSTGRIHTTFNQALTNTGRLSSQNPNLQNIPVRTPRGKDIRRAFKASKGHLLLSADYSQIELRVLAHITGDAGLVHAFREDLDVHAATASEIFGVKLSDVTPELRRKAKAVNFGIAYGQGAFGLAESLGISRTEAKEIIDSYFKKFPGVRNYMDSAIRMAKEQGFVESYFGRRRNMWELKSPSVQVQKFGERAAINAPIQATASDLMKLAMVKIHAESPVAILLQVHDELLFESPVAEVEEHAQLVKKIMEGVVEFKVPMRVNVAWGKSWFEAHA